MWFGAAAALTLDAEFLGDGLHRGAIGQSLDDHGVARLPLLDARQAARERLHTIGAARLSFGGGHGAALPSTDRWFAIFFAEPILIFLSGGEPRLHRLDWTE
jgi:hypothetical protein